MFSLSKAPLKKIKRVEFGVLSPEEITAHSVAEIDTVDHHVSPSSSINSNRGTLNDPRLGCVDQTSLCYSYNENMTNCPGHFGHIVLSSPMYHIGYIKLVKKILECICPKASRVPILPEDALNILRRMSDETCRLIGLNPAQTRPEWMILTVLPVPPPCVRPSVQVDSGSRGEDDLTHMLTSILRGHGTLVGTLVYPGARYVVNSRLNRRIDLEIAQKAPEIEIGDIVERQMITGDTVLFNRQPSLHKMSMMAHTVRVMPWSTFRLNVNVCAPYNADFDGDEMNLHMPQSHSSVAELKTLSMVSQLIVSPQSNKPVNRLVQDTLCGIRRFTKRDTFLRREEVMNLLMELSLNSFPVLPPPAIWKPVPMWTGKQIISLTLPPIELKGHTLTHADREDEFQKETMALDEFETRRAEQEFYNLPLTIPVS
ncbi:UNVERIFIED_CONTAM: DNA-directed RNA polymerase II subunit rpb1 [Siphonaria sp. JEL0065]|nr:DNA-directed RNA polymerase II subunit rpb1 [Siphonaria sp. JEL0065]